VAANNGVMHRRLRLPDKHPPVVTTGLRQKLIRGPHGFTVVPIFISSPFLDMNGERDVLMRLVLPELNARLRPSGVKAMFVDLRWGLTEEGGKELGALEASLRGVDACHKFVLHIASDRFGWDMGTTPVEDGGEGLDYKVLEAGHRLYDPAYAESFKWLLDRDQVPGGLSVTAVEMGHCAQLYEVGEKAPCHVVAMIRDGAFQDAIPTEFKGNPPTVPMLR